jgi:integrase
VAQVRKRQTSRGEARYDVRIRVNGRVITKTFRRRRDADAFAVRLEAERLRGTAVDPRLGRIIVEDWCLKWLRERPDLRPKTRELYRYLLDDYVFPDLGTVPLGRLSVSTIRSWHAALFASHPAIAPKAYQVLRAALNCAVNDGVIAVNPCRIKGAGQTRPAERPIASIAEVEALSKSVNERFKLMVVLAYWCSLRLGELRALRRSDIDVLHGWIEVREQIVDVGGRLVSGPPKTEAGRRRVAIPPHIRQLVAGHLERLVPTVDGFVFTGPLSDGPLPSVTWRRAWDQARKATGLRHFHFHDLRHSGNTLAAATGASTRELMARMGHSSPRAALIYQHATADRDQAIAAALSEVAERAGVVPMPVPSARGGEGDTSHSNSGNCGNHARDGRAMDERSAPTAGTRKRQADQVKQPSGADGIRTRGLLVANQAL